MVALPAIFVFSLYFNLISGYTLLQDEENEIIWPSEYHFKLEKLDFISSIKETSEVWYSAELNRSRIDTNGGTVKKFYYADTGYSYSVFPMTTEDVTNEIACLSRPFYGDQVDFLPDASGLEYTGETLTLYDKVVDVWTGSDSYIRNVRTDTTLYVFKTDSGVDLPVQKITKSYNLDIGVLKTHVITNYYDFGDVISEEELTVDDVDICDEMVLGKNFKTDLKFYHPDIPMELDQAFESYSNHHNKQYHDEEHEMRKKIFENNWRMVEEHNSKNLGFRVELNEFSDQTDEELKYLMGTYVSPHPDPDVQPFPYTLEEIDDLVQELPENFDLRMEGVINAVKNQGHCGSCWAFCTTAAVEGAIARATGARLLDLSEQSLVDCAWGFDNMGCLGGTLSGAMKYVFTHGIPTEEQYGVYSANDGFCQIQNVTEPFKIIGFGQVTPRNPNALKVALYNYGPVTIAIYASPLMKHYANGLFYDFSCDEDSNPNHGVTVIGYGVRDGEDYWIVKNSWGETWGEDGYILISAKNNNCFVLDSPYYPIV